MVSSNFVCFFFCPQQILVYAYSNPTPSELSTQWLRAKNSEKDKNAILSANFAKTKIVKPGTYENIVLKCIPGYTFSNNQLLQVEIAFDTIVTVWSCDQVVYGCSLS